MKIFKLIRIAYIEDGTFGILIDGTIPFCLTLERPWLNNQRNVSCIPKGSYMCQRIVSLRFGDTFEIMDVPGRSHILFHKGNLKDDSHGCVILGEQFEPIDGKNAVLASGKAFQEFKDRLKDIEYFKLEIKDTQ